MTEPMTISMIRNLLAEKKYDQALVQAKSLQENNPDEMRYAALVAEVYRSQGDYESAMLVYKGIIEVSSR